MSMISKQVDALRSVAQAAKIEGCEMYANHLKAAADTIEEQGEKIHALNMERSLAHYNNGWVPCSDRMPEEYGEYLCVDKYGEFILGMPSYSKREGYFVETDSQFMYDAVAWMPLPDPWKGEEE